MNIYVLLVLSARGAGWPERTEEAISLGVESACDEPIIMNWKEIRAIMSQRSPTYASYDYYDGSIYLRACCDNPQASAADYRRADKEDHIIMIS